MFDSDQTAPPLRLDAVTLTLPSAAGPVDILRGVSLTVKAGERVAVVGPSGSGKSSLIAIAAGLERPTAGTVSLFGTELAPLSEDGRARLRRGRVALVFQQFHLLPQLSALDNVMLPMIYAGVPPEERRERARQALERVGLAKRIDNRPNQLSGGQHQRVAVARAIINRPALLLADEPTGALDSRTTEEVLAIFEELNGQGITILLVTHEQEVGDRARRVVHFRDGRIAS